MSKHCHEWDIFPDELIGYGTSMWFSHDLDARFNHPPNCLCFRMNTWLSIAPKTTCRKPQDRIDPDFSEELTLEVIERGSAVHCVFWTSSWWSGVRRMENHWLILPSLKLTVATWKLMVGTWNLGDGFQSYLGKWCNLTDIFQVGWNHQGYTSFREGSISKLPYLPPHMSVTDEMDLLGWIQVSPTWFTPVLVGHSDSMSCVICW